MNFTWPDLVIGALLLVFALKGWKRGFVSELAGAVALFCTGIAAFRYPGTLDDIAHRYAHARPGAAHLAGLVVFSIAVYLAVMAIAWILRRFAALPVVSLGNSAAGAAIGLAKALAGTWAVLYVALFFPLTRDVRADLHRSTLVAIVTQPNAHVDALMRGALPAFAKQYADPIFTNHHV